MSTRAQTKKKTKKASRRKSGGPEWPTARKVMMRPARREYVRKLIPDKGCVFCMARETGVKANSESLLLFDGDHAMAILNKFPYNTGHLLVLPRHHEADLTDLSDEEYAELMWLVRESSRLLRDTYNPDGLNIGLNWGKAAGAGIPEHLHFHLIPRWSGDTNFFPLIAETKVVIETVEQSYERLQPLFSELEVKSLI